MKILAMRKPCGFHLRTKQDRERRFDFHNRKTKGRNTGNMVTLVALLVLLLVLWHIIN